MDLPSLPPPPMELPLPPMDIGFLPPPIIQETPTLPDSLPLPPSLPDLPSQPETDSVSLPLPPPSPPSDNNIPPPIVDNFDDWSTPIEGTEAVPQGIEIPPPQIELTEEEKQAIEEKNRNDAASRIQAYVRTYHAVIDYDKKKTAHLFDSLTAAAGPTLSSPTVGRARVTRNNRRPPSRGHRAPGAIETPETASSSTGENGAEGGEGGENGETTPDKPRVRMMDGGRPMAMFDPTAVKLRTSSASASDIIKKRPMSEEIPEFAKVNLRQTGNKPDEEEAAPEELGALRMASSGSMPNKKKLDFKNRSRSSAPVGGFLLGKDISSASDSFLPPPPPDSMISPGRQSPKSPSSSESMSLPPSHLPPPSNLPPSHLPPPPGGMPPPGSMPPPPPSGFPLPPSSMPPPLPQEPVDDAKKKKKEKVKNKLSKFFKTRVKKETLIQKGVLKEDPTVPSDLPPPPGSSLPPPLGSSLPPPPGSLPPPFSDSLPPPPGNLPLPPGGLPPPLPAESVNNCMICSSDCSKKKDKKQCSKCNRIVCQKCIKKKGLKTKICLNCWKE